MAAIEFDKSVLKDVFSTNVKGYYRFEAGALTTDSSASGNTLTNNGGVSESVSGMFGGCADFGNANTSKSLSRTDTYGITVNANRTVLGWIKIPADFSGADTYYAIHTMSYGTEKVNYELYYQRQTGVNGLVIQRNRANVGNENLTYPVSIGTGWVQVGYKLNGTLCTLYLNGRPVGTQTINTGNGSAAVTTRTEMGYNTYRVGNYFSGMFDDFIVTDNVLTDEQIRELYEGRMLGEFWPQAGLVALYHGSDVNDYSGNGYTLTNTAGVAFNPGKFNKAFDFGASNTTKYLSIANTMGITNGAISMGCWFQNNGTTVNDQAPALMGHGDNVTDVHYVMRRTTTGYDFYRAGYGGGGTSGNVAFACTPAVAPYYDLVFLTYDGTNVRGYVNGNLVGTVVASGNGVGYAGSFEGFAMGCSFSWTGLAPASSATFSSISGKIDEAAVYNRALSPQEIRNYYAWSKGLRTGVL